MLNNALALLVYWTRRQRKGDAPLFYLHQNGNELWQVIVQRVPDSEAQAA